MAGETSSTTGSIQTVTANGFSWITVERPSRADVDELVRGRDLHPSDLELALDRRQTPGVLRGDRYLLVLVHVPVAPPSGQQRTVPISQVAIFVRPDSLLTVHTGEVRSLTRFFQQLAADGALRDAALAVGVGGVLFGVVQRLVDVTTAARARIDQAISVQEESVPRPATPEAVASVAQLRREVRALRRLAAPLPTLTRGLGDLELGLNTGDDWAHLALRCDRLVEALDDSADALQGLLLAMDLANDLRRTADLRVLTAVAATTLPVIVVAVLLSMPPMNPLASQPNGFAVSLAIVGAVFLGALVVLKRRRIV